MQQFLLATLLLLAVGAEPITAQQATDVRNQDIYVSVVDSSGKPATGLTAADFTIKEDGVAREVLKAGPATEPLTISLLVDDSQAATDAIQFIRDGLEAFVDHLKGKAEIAIATFGERPTNRLDYTTSTAALDKTISGIFQRTGSGSYLLDALIDVSRGLEMRKAARPTIVVVMTEGVEFSNRNYSQVLDALQKSGAALHVIAIGQPASSQDDEMRNRNISIAEGTARTGGRRDQVLALSGIPARLTQLADELANQYVVTYARPEQLIPPEKIEVSVTRPGLTARARTRVPER
jgi:VWFA-related protein